MTLYNILTTSELVDISTRTLIGDKPLAMLTISDLSEIYSYTASIHTAQDQTRYTRALCMMQEITERVIAKSVTDYVKRLNA